MNLQNIEAIYPLSPFQASLLSGDLRALDRSAYCGQMICSLHGRLDTEAFERAWRLIIDQHPILRTMFAWENLEKPVQLVHRQIDFSLLQHDWRGLSPEQQQELLDTLVEAECEAGFDASTAPLMRLCLCRLSDDDYYLLWSYDLLVLDNWSLPLLLEKAVAVYEGQLKGQVPQVEQGRLYQDYVAWLKQQDVTQAEAFWKESLDSLNGSDNLNGLFQPNPPTHETGNGDVHIPMPFGLTASLQALASEHQLDFQALVQGAWALLLSRYSGESEIVYGTHVSGRPADLTGASLMIGPFSNVLPVHVHVSSSTPVLAWLKSLDSHLNEVRRYSFYPATRWSKNNGGVSELPTFVSTVQIENPPSNGILNENGASLHVRHMQTVEQTKSPLTLMAPSHSEASLQLSYNPATFDDATAARLTQHFENLLTGILQQPHLSISQLSILSHAEVDQLLYAFNETVAPLPASSIQALFQEQVQRAPDAVAVRFGDASLTYLELEWRANQLARHLVRQGVSGDTVVAVCVDRSLELCVALLGILKAGAAYLPLDPSYPLARLSFMLADAGSPLLVTTEALAEELPAQWVAPVLLDSEWDVIALNSDEALAETVVSAEQLAYVMYTSGSTGTPKGVAVTHRGVVRLVTSPNYVRLDAEQTLLQLAPLTFDASTLEVWGALLNGARLVVMPPSAPTLDEISRVIEAEGVTTLWLTAGLFHLMVDEQLEGLSRVEQLLAGGDVLSVRHVEKYLAVGGNGDRRLINGYGPTENTTFTCCHVMDGQTRLNGSVPIGRPITNTQVYVLDAEMQVAPLGVVGELYIGGAGLARGYFHQPELTAERFVPHPHSPEAGERLYRTGDMVRWHEGGELEFIGRVDGQVKIRGFRIEVGEIEAVLVGHAGVREAVVLVRADERGDKRLAAYVVKEAESEVTAGELQEYLRERLPEYMQVQWVVEVEELPLTPNGKVDRRALQALGVEPESGGERVLARTPAEEILAAIWAEVLGRETVSVHDNFFALGGHSLLATQVISRVREAFGQEVALRSLFEQPTVAGLAREIEAGRELGAEWPAPPLERVAPFSLIGDEDRLRLPAGVVDAYPVTALQAGMLFHTELAPEAGQYHDIFSYHLRMPFDEEALPATLRQLVERHAILRTSFNLSDFSEPLQLVHEEVSVPLEIEDLRLLSDEEQEQTLTKWMATEKQYRFDWRNAPLLRFYLHRRDEESFQFSLSFHHAILDGWSLATMLTELFNVYASVLQGDERGTNAPLSSSFRDFVAAEQAVLNSAEARQYWTTMLSEAPHSRLPRLGQSAGRSRVAGHRVAISEDLSLALRALARTAVVPLKSVLLAAHLRALSVLTGSNDVLTGIVSHGRTETADTERVLGLFLNTLPFRRRLAGGTWLQLVQETFAAERELLPFRRYPMARMQQDIGNNTTLFEVIFNFVHFNVYDEMQKVGGFEVLGMDGVATTNFTLAVDFAIEVGAQIGLDLQYDAAELSAEQIEAMGRNYLTILESMTRTPLARYEQQSLLSEAERRTILYEWNDEPAGLDPHLFIHELFEAQAAQNPQAIAVAAENHQLTYDELNRRANQLAHHLQRRGVGPEEVVGICVERSPEMLVALLGTLKSGGAYLPLDPTYPQERLSLMVADAQPRVLLTHERLRELMSGYEAKVICLDTDWETIAREPDTNPPSDLLSVTNQAFIIYTSGSTGKPKGVMITHGGLANYIEAFNETCHITSADRVLQFFSISFDGHAEDTYPALTRGATVVLRTDEMLSSPQVFLRQSRELGITVLDLPTAYWQELTAGSTAEDWSLERLRLVIIGGELALTQHLVTWRRFAGEQVQLGNGYGPTETTIAATWYYPPAQPDEQTLAFAGVPIGRPMRNLQAYVLDKHLQPVPIGVAGELHLGGAGLGRGYLNNPELTAERFIPHPFSRQAGACLYKTGDVARYVPSGDLIVTGRTDQQVKIRGFRVELGEIEAALTRHPAIKECVVVAKAESSGSKRLIAYVVQDQDSPTTNSELRQYLKGRLPDYMIPSAFMTLPELPLTPNDKVDRRALPEPDSAGIGPGTDFIAPRTAVEEIVAGIWSQLLQVERIGVADNFFELGGHSLLATRVISRVRDAFGQEVALRSLFEQPTVAGLAQTVETAQRAGVGLSVPAIVPISRAAELPLSFAQQRLWFLDQLEPGSSFYNLPAAVRLAGELNVAALERTLSEIIRRHETLRTTFVAVDGKPKQVIKPFTPVVLPVFDVSDLNPAEREAETRYLLSEEASRPFDLALGPLVRACLVRTATDEHVALVTMHHIVSDGWSTGIFIREVAALYGAYVRGEESPLEELPIQYADFAHWQRGWLQEEVLAAQVSYWREALAEMPAMLELPTDRPRPREQTFNGAMVSLVMPEELTSQLKELSQRERVTLFMTLLAGFQSLLYRHSGQDDIVVGTPIANRRYRELEDLIGFFVNTLTLRARWLQRLTFSKLLERVREVTLSAYAHQDVPFEKLVEELHPERDLSRNPIFQVLFALQNAPSSALELPGLTLEGQGVESRATRFDLECHLWEEGQVLGGVFVYNTDLFDQTTIARLAANYQTLLQSIVANAAVPVTSLRLLRAEDERQLLYGWNETSAAYPQGVVHELFAQQVEQTPHQTAVVFGDVSLTFVELNQRSNLLASYLQSKGVRADTVVGVMLERSVEMLVAVLGVLKAGGAYLPLDPGYPVERLKFMLADAAARVLLTQEHLAGNTSGAEVELIRLDTDWQTIVAQAVEEQPRAAVTGDNLAYVIYTSGSTGQPKGVAMTHRALVNLLHWQMRRSRPAPRTLQFSSLSFDVSFQEIFSSWCAGATLVLLREEARRDAGALWELLIAERIERLFLPFVALQYLAEASEHQKEFPASLREVITAGEQLKITRHIRGLFAKLEGCTLENQYGPSETHVVSALRLEGRAADWPELPAIGRPIANAQLYLLDEGLQVVPVGVAGELYLGGEVLARGYLNRAEASAEKFLPHPFAGEGGARLYRTGDRARYLADGNIEFLGRRDQQVKVRGYRIELGEVEAALRQQSQVREAVVISSATTSEENRLVAYVLTAKEAGATATALRARLEELLPEYMIPAAFVMMEAFPLTPSGKIDRRALPAPERSARELANAFVAPRLPSEEIVAAIWAEVLRRETVGVHDNFFELGGHSLLATQVISRVRDAFGQEVALRSLFERPTVAGLVRSIELMQRTGAALQAPPLVRVRGAERLPLSFAQQRLWFLDQMEPGSAFYNIPAAVRLRGALNIEALEHTLSEVVRRHEVLRTRFIAVDGEPVQIIDPPREVRLTITDLSALAEAERTAETQRLVEEESARPFDLMRGPLLRMRMIRLDAEEHVALVTMHHIVSDGWSIGVLVREVAALYAAYVRGEESPLEELPIQYADFAHWQRAWLQGEVLAAQLDYWREELADVPTILELPIDKPRPPVQTYRGAHHPLQLSTELSEQLRDLSRRHGSTLFMTLLSAFDLLLCRYAGQEQVLVGSPIANRNRSETEGLIGFFVNTLVLRGDVRGNPSFRELLRRVRETALGAYAHQDLPFEKLVEELQPERDMSRSPLFQVMFVLQNAPGEALELEDLSLSGVESAGDTAKFELTLGLQELGGMVVGGINYNRDLYEAETIRRLVASYQRVLQAVVADAEQRVLEIELLSEAERRQIIEGWNETEREYAPALTLSELFEAQAARTPEAVALLFEDTALSYRELNERANQLARYLQRTGVGPEVLVGILMQRSVQMVVAVLGILKAGGAYVPLDPSYPVERLAFMAQDSGLRMLLTQELLSEVAGEYVGETLSLNEQWDSIAGESIENLQSGVRPESLAYVIYTSGSTGRPKGVLVSHENVVRLLEATQAHFEFNQSDVWTLFHSYAFDFSVWEIWGALAHGGKLVIVPYWISRSAEAFHRLLASEQVTVLNQTPSAFRQLMVADESAGGGVELKLRLVIFGGEVLELQNLRPWFARHGDRTPRLVNMFGITETTVHVTYRPLTAADLELASSNVVGRPLGCLQVYLLDERGQPVPIGVSAEICVGGTGLARGYLNRMALTAERFVPHPFSASPGARLYRSGDLARFLPDGDIEYLGRIDQQVKVRGYRVELGEIEAALAEHEGVRECTVVAAADANGETKLLAYFVGGQQQPAPSVTALREFLQEKLPEHMIPAAFIVLDAMPLTPNGKIDRRALPAPDQSRPQLGKEFVAPRTPVEEIVAGIWEELLDVRPIGVRDDFFSLGGHSLMAVRLMARIQGSFGQHLPLASLFQGATIEKLASLLREQPHDHSASSLVGIQPKGEGLPFFCVHPGGGNVLCYKELANHLGLDRPFYGLQARGLAENQVPHTRIEEMATYYIESIRSVQPDGPYLLGGWSMGGVVAFEMAQQLEAQGQRVSLLALMDAKPMKPVEAITPLDDITLLTNFARDLGLSVDSLKLSTDELAKLDSEELLSYVLRRAIEAGIVPQDIQLAHARRLFKVFKINVQAMQSYRPQASSMRVTLLKAEEGVEAPDETMGWGALTSGKVEIHAVPGSHFTIVREPYVRSLAERLADCINRATLKSFASLP